MTIAGVLCFEQLRFGFQRIGDAGATEVAETLVANFMLKEVCTTLRIFTTIAKPHSGCTGTGVRTECLTIAASALPASLLGAALSRPQSDRRCGCCGACEGTCGQPNSDHGLLPALRCGHND